MSPEPHFCGEKGEKGGVDFGLGFESSLFAASKQGLKGLSH